jgi:hypothetical protein
MCVCACWRCGINEVKKAFHVSLIDFNFLAVDAAAMKGLHEKVSQALSSSQWLLKAKFFSMKITTTVPLFIYVLRVLYATLYL